MKMDVSWKDINLTMPMIAIFLTSLIPITIKVLHVNREQNNLDTLI